MWSRCRSSSCSLFRHTYLVEKNDRWNRPYQLYDFLKAPVELENLAARPENAALVEELSAKLEAGWRAARP